MAKLRLQPEEVVNHAVAAALGRKCLSLPDAELFGQRLAVTEMRVACIPDVIASISERLPASDPGGGVDGDGVQLDFLLSDVVVYCPIGMPAWQTRAKVVFQEHVNHWRAELERLRRELHTEPPPGKAVRMFAVPFGRFLAPNETSATWVSNVLPVSVPYGHLFENPQAAGLPSGGATTIWYYSRPFILWPVAAGTLRHITYDGQKRFIERPRLDDVRLQQRHGNTMRAGSSEL